MCKLYIFVNFSSTQLLSPSALWKFGCTPVICKSPEVGVTIGNENKLCVVLESSHLPGSEIHCNARYLVPCGLCGNWFFSFLYWIPFEICGTWVYVDLVTEQSSCKNSWRGAAYEETGENLHHCLMPCKLEISACYRTTGWHSDFGRSGSWGSTSDCVTMHDCKLVGDTPLCVLSCPDGLLDIEQALQKALSVWKGARKASGMLSPLQKDEYQCLLGSPCLQMSLVGQHN